MRLSLKEGMKMNLISTGNMIKAYLKENGFSITDLANAAKVTSRTIYRIINDETPLSYEVAKGINNLLPGIEVEFLMIYDAKYQVQKKEELKRMGIKDVDATIKFFDLKKLYPEFKNDKLVLLETAEKVFGIDNLNNMTLNLDDKLSVQYSKAANSKDKESKLWLISTYSDFENSLEGERLKFNKEAFEKYYEEIRYLAGTTNYTSTMRNIRNICKYSGINFYFRHSIPNSRIKAVTLKDNEGYVYIFISDLFKCIQNLWLSFVHEMIHIKNNDFDVEELLNEGSESNVDNERFVSDEAANYFLPKYKNKLKNIDSSNLSNLFAYAEESNCPKGIAAEIYRNFKNIYNDSTINGYIDYYESALND